jgi:hypothetical protein
MCCFYFQGAKIVKMANPNEIFFEFHPVGQKYVHGTGGINGQMVKREK